MITGPSAAAFLLCLCLLWSSCHLSQAFTCYELGVRQDVGQVLTEKTCPATLQLDRCLYSWGGE